MAKSEPFIFLPIPGVFEGSKSLKLNHRSIVTLRYFATILSCSLLTMPLGCTKKSPTASVIEEVCRQELKNSIKKKPLGHVEKRFFLDGRSRNILQFEDVYAQSFNEKSASATASRYVQIFGFQKSNGDPVRLLRSPKNGGMSVNKPNLVIPQIRCEVVWSLFKGKAVRADLKFFLSVP